MRDMKKLLMLFSFIFIANILLVHIPIKAEAASDESNTYSTTLLLGTSFRCSIPEDTGKVKWKSSNKTVAVVSSTGIITAKKEGVATITAKAGKKTYKYVIKAIKPYIIEKKKSMYVGESYTLGLIGTGIKSAKSSDKKVATVSQKGKVVAKKAGKATITLKGKNGISYKCKITVKEPYISSKKKTLKIGEFYLLNLYGTEIKSAKSSNEAVAKVNNKGEVVAKKVGKTTITLRGKNRKSYKCEIVVKNIYLEEMIRTLEIGESFTLKLNGAKIESITSSKKDVAVVDKKGKVTAKKVGSTVITVTDTSGRTYNCYIDVVKNHEWMVEKIIKEATCSEQGTKLYFCIHCGANKKGNYEDKEAHSYKWQVTKKPSENVPKCVEDFGSRTAYCKYCEEQGITEVMINIGDQVVCGMFDEQKANELCYYVNHQRQEGCWYTISDVWGTTIAAGVPYELKRTEDLDFLALIRAAESAVEFRHTDEKGNPLYWCDSEVLAWGYGSALEVELQWMRSSNHRIAMTDPKNMYNGAASFWYDSDGSGKNLTPIWVMTFNSELYNSHAQLRFLTDNEEEYQEYVEQNSQYGILCKENILASDVVKVTEKNCDIYATHIGLYIRANILLFRDKDYTYANMVKLVQDVYSETGEILYKKGYYEVVSGNPYVYLIDDAPDEVKKNYDYIGTVNASDVTIEDGAAYVNVNYDGDGIVHLIGNVYDPKTGEILYAEGYYIVLVTEDKEKPYNIGKFFNYILGDIKVYRDSSCISKIVFVKV